MDVNEIKKLYKDAASVTWFRNAIGHLLSRIEELEKIISDDVLKDHDGCQIYHDEEYTKLESKFYEAEAKIKGLENELSNIDEW